MQVVNKRQMKIVQLLRDANDYLPTCALAKELGVSVKTIRNDIATLKGIFQKQHCGEIESKPRCGVMLHSTQDQWLRFNDIATEDSQPSIQRKCDRKACLYLILREGATSYHSLCSALYITPAELKRLLPDIEAWLQRNGIRLKSGTRKGIVLSCEDWRRRIAITRVLVSMQKEAEPELRGLETECRVPDPANYFLRLLPHYQVVSVCRVLDDAERAFGFEFDNDSYKQCALQFAFCIHDIQRGRPLKECGRVPCSTDTAFDAQLAQYITQRIEEEYSLKIPEAERNFIAMAVEMADFFSGWDAGSIPAGIANTPALNGLTRNLLKILSEITGSDLEKDQFLLASLTMMLRSLIGRAKYGTYLDNPLQYRINREYSQYLSAVHALAARIESELRIVINVDELSFFAMHISEAIERSSSTVRACIVCDSGIGIPRVLKEKLERRFRNLSIIESISTRKLRPSALENIDLIITTAARLECRGHPVAMISAVPGEAELYHLGKTIQAV